MPSGDRAAELPARRQDDRRRGLPPAGEDLRSDLFPALLHSVPGHRPTRLLGKGGFAEVWETVGPDGTLVALRFAPLDLRLDPRVSAILLDLHHPNVLRTHGIWESDGFLIASLELADGTLWDRFLGWRERGWGGIPGPELSRRLLEAAEGIDHLNSPRHPVGTSRVSLQHRDIKPRNLLLVGDRLKVGDFGQIRIMEHTRSDHVSNLTPTHAAPEFFEGRTTSQSDQYSLAVTCCQLRTGRLPFEGDADAQRDGHLHRPPDLDALPEAERAVVARALSKKPCERWPSCRAFVRAFAAAADQHHP